MININVLNITLIKFSCTTWCKLTLFISTVIILQQKENNVVDNMNKFRTSSDKKNQCSIIPSYWCIKWYMYFREKELIDNSQSPFHPTKTKPNNQNNIQNPLALYQQQPYDPCSCLWPWLIQDTNSCRGGGWGCALSLPQG